MSAALAKAAPRSAELCVFMDCHAYLLAISAVTVERLLLAEEVVVRSIDGEAVDPALGTKLAGDHVVSLGADRAAAWDLSSLLEVPELDKAFVVVRVPFRGIGVPIALRTGACLFVQKLDHKVPLPKSLFRRRHGALANAFATSSVGGVKTSVRVGFELDPLHLFEPEELERSAHTLAEANEPR